MNCPYISRFQENHQYCDDSDLKWRTVIDNLRLPTSFARNVPKITCYPCTYKFYQNQADVYTPEVLGRIEIAFLPVHQFKENLPVLAEIAQIGICKTISYPYIYKFCKKQV